MITAIGNPVYDYIKTRKIETDGRVLSGCSTNAVLALAKLGEKTRLIGAIGDDFKIDFVSQLDKLDIESVIVDSEQSGGFSLIYYDNFGSAVPPVSDISTRSCIKIPKRFLSARFWARSRSMRSGKSAKTMTAIFSAIRRDCFATPMKTSGFIMRKSMV